MIKVIYKGKREVYEDETLSPTNSVVLDFRDEDGDTHLQILTNMIKLLQFVGYRFSSNFCEELKDALKYEGLLEEETE